MVCGNCNKTLTIKNLNIVHVYQGEDILQYSCPECGHNEYIVRLSDLLSEYRIKNQRVKVDRREIVE